MLFWALVIFCVVGFAIRICAEIYDWGRSPHETTLAALEQMKASGVIKVEVVSAQDGFCCATCSLAAGVYPINQAPILPFRGCSSSKGKCRCSYRPVG